MHKLVPLNFLNLFERERESTSWEVGRGRGEADSPLSRKPDVVLNPRTLRSWPEPKADASLTEPHSHPKTKHFQNGITQFP